MGAYEDSLFLQLKGALQASIDLNINVYMVWHQTTSTILFHRIHQLGY